MYLERISIVQTTPCLGDEGRMKAKACLSTNVEEMLPYINGDMKNATYLADIKKLTFNKGMKIICLESKFARITKLDNITDAYMEFDWLKDMINNIYDRRDTIVPIETIRKRPTALQIYKLLPQKKECEKCGQTTCMAFACRLMQGQDHPSKCPLLYSGEYDESKVKLIVLLGVDEQPEQEDLE